jgi:hypothetical protein
MKVSELGLKAADSIENQQSPYRSGAQKTMFQQSVIIEWDELNRRRRRS